MAGGRITDYFLPPAVAASRPADPGVPGAVFVATDTRVISYWSGGAWHTGLVMGPSGTGHSAGLVPDPGPTSGTAKFLCEDATWKTAGGVATYSNSGTVATSGALAIDSTGSSDPRPRKRLVSVYRAAPGSNLVPTMTDNTHPSGVASSQPAGNYHDPWHAFSPGDSTGWVGPNGTHCWLQYQFTSGQIITAAAITCIAAGSGGGTTDAPNNFTIQGSDDGSTFDVLATLVGETGWTDGQRRVYSFSNTHAYAYYRVDITAAGTYPHIGRLELLGAGVDRLCTPSEVQIDLTDDVTTTVTNLSLASTILTGVVHVLL